MTTHNNETRGAGGSAACPMYPHLRPTELLLSSSTTNTRLRKSKSRFGQHPTYLHGVHISVLGLVALAVASSPAWAVLGGRPGQTENQAATGTAVQTACGQLGPAGGVAGTLPALQQQLFNRCRELVNTANDLDGLPAPNTLDLTEQQLAAALQQVAPEEVITQGTMAVETSNGQVTNIGARLAALHRGAGGFSASGLSFIAGGRTLEPAMLGATMPVDGARGGGAAADEGFSKLGGFINGTISSGEKDITTLEDGFDVDAVGITAGVDYRFSDKFVFGGALGLTNLDADIDTFGSSTNPVVNGGKVESDGFTLSGYGTYFVSDKYYIDGIISLGKNDYDITRSIFYTPGPGGSGTAAVVTAATTADTDSDQVALSIGGGYQGSSGGATWGAYARLDYLKVEIDSFTEAGAGGLNLFVDDQEVKSLVSIIGGRISKAFSRHFGVLIPQGRLEWHHEFENDSRSIVTKYANDPFDTFFISTTDDPDEDFFVLGGGVSAVFKGGTQAFIFLETVLELEDVTNNVITIGGRREF